MALDLDLESNRQTPGRNITPMASRGNYCWIHNVTPRAYA